MSLAAAEARARALGLLEADPDPAVFAAGDDARAIAWALKDLCYEAWSSEPKRAALAADRLRSLVTAGVPLAQAGEVEALAQWTRGIAQVTRGELAEAVTCFDRAAAGLRAAGLADPAAQTQVPKIMALSMLGEHAEAARCAEIAQRELLAHGNVQAASRVSQNLGGLHFLRDDYTSAARHYREAAVLFARLGDHAHSVLADIGLADALTATGNFEEALRIYARARMRAGHRNLELQLAQLDESVALLDQARGRYRESLAGFESARRRYETLAVPQYLAVAEKQLGDAYLDLRLLPEAEALLDAAVAKFHALDMPDEEALALAQRGRAEALLGKPTADASFLAAAALFTAQDNAVGQALVVLSRAELLLAQGVAEAALEGAEQAACAFERAGQATGSARAGVMRAEALLKLGRVAEAGIAFAAGLERARALQQQQLEVQCLTGQGLAALASNDRTAASLAFEAAIALFEDQRRALPIDELRRAFLTDHLRPYQEQLRAAVEAGSGAETLVQLERFRARALDDRLAEGETADADDPEAQPQRDRLNWLYGRLRRLDDEGGHSPRLTAEMLRTERDLLERARRRRLALPRQDATHADGFGVAALQGALHDGDALIEYGALDDELFACVVTRDEVLLHRRLAAWPEVVESLRSARFQIETLCHGASPVERHLATLTGRAQRRLQQLHALVWAPLAPALKSCRRVLVVPHAELGALPFAALHDGDRAVGERHELAIAPSARLALRGLLQRPVPARRVVALAESSQLPHTAREVTTIAALFAAAQTFIGDAATLPNLRTHAAEADVLHLACHAQFRSDNPRFSALHLHDGALTVDDTEALRLKACTVVLSACETGRAESGVGDEMVGLVRAFLTAGASRVIASQWPVDDAINVDFMSLFYAALTQGAAPATALAAAQRQTRLAHPHPYYWASFTLYGGW